MRRQPDQLQLDLRVQTRGGRCKGAGRKKIRTSGMPHLRRPALAARHPVHVTLKLRPGLPSLRGEACFPPVKDALKASRRRLGMRLVHFSVQSNHLHLLVEAADRVSLARAVKGLAVRLARRLNQKLGTRGTVFPERFHAHVLRTPSEVRNALGYLLHNFARQLERDGYVMPPGQRDLLSSGLSSPRLPLTARRWWPRRAGCCARDGEGQAEAGRAGCVPAPWSTDRISARSNLGWDSRAQSILPSS